MSGSVTVSDFNLSQDKIESTLPCVQTMIHSYNDERYIGFIVNVKTTITTEHFQSKQKLFTHDFNVGDTEWSLKVNLNQDNEEDDSVKVIHHYFKLKSGSFTGVIHQILDYSTVSLSNIWTLNDARHWSGENVKKSEIYSLPFHINMVLRCRKTYSEFNGTRKHTLLTLSKDIEDILDLQFDKPDYVTLRGDGWELHARKKVLIKTSPVFEAMFSHDMKESQENSVEITELSLETVKSMLTFMYSGSLVLNNQRSIYELCLAADKYCLDSLRLICDQELCLDLSIDSIVERMITAVTYKLPLACAICSTYVRDHFKSIVDRDDWEDLAGHKETVLLITRRMGQLGCPSLNYRN